MDRSRFHAGWPRTRRLLSVLALAVSVGLAAAWIATPSVRPARALSNGAERLPADALALIELHNLQDWPHAAKPAAHTDTAPTDAAPSAQPADTIDAFDALLPDAARLWSIAHDAHVRAFGPDAPLTRALRKSARDIYGGVLRVGARGAEAAILIEVPADVDVVELFDALVRAPRSVLRPAAGDASWGRARLASPIRTRGGRAITFEFAWRECEWWLATDASSMSRALQAGARPGRDRADGDVIDANRPDAAVRLADVAAYREAVARHPKLRFDTARLQDVWMWVDIAAMLDAINALTPETKQPAYVRLAVRSGLTAVRALVCSAARVAAPEVQREDSGGSVDNESNTGDLNDTDTNQPFTNDPPIDALADAIAGEATMLLRANALAPDDGDDTSTAWWLHAARSRRSAKASTLLSAIPADAVGYVLLAVPDASSAWQQYIEAQSALVREWPAAFGDRDVLRLDRQVHALDFHSGYPLETVVRQFDGEFAIAWMPRWGAAPDDDQGDEDGDNGDVPDSDHDDHIVRGADGQRIPELLPDRDALFIARVRDRRRTADVLANWLSRLVAREDRDDGGAGEGRAALLRTDRDDGDDAAGFTLLQLQVAPFIAAAVVGDVMVLGDARRGSVERAVDALLGDAPSALSEASALRPLEEDSRHGVLVRWAFDGAVLSPRSVDGAREPPVLMPLLDVMRRVGSPRPAHPRTATRAVATVDYGRPAVLFTARAPTLRDAWDACAAGSIDLLQALAAIVRAR